LSKLRKPHGGAYASDGIDAGSTADWFDKFDPKPTPTT